MNQIQYSAFLQNPVPLEIVAAPLKTSKLEITSSIYSLYSFGEWVCSIDPALFEQGLIFVGQQITFTFFGDFNSKPLIVTMSILSIMNGPTNSALSLDPSFIFSLVSPNYFDDGIDSVIYKGNVSDILNQIAITSWAGNIPYTFIAPTYDPVLYRYRTQQTALSFVAERLIDKAMGKNNTSVFAYCQVDGGIELLSKADMDQQLAFEAIDINHPQLTLYTQSSKGENTLIMLNKTLRLNMSEHKSLWHDTNVGFEYLYHDGSVNTYNTSPILPPLGFDRDNKFTFVDNVLVGGLTKMIRDDNMNSYADVIYTNLNNYNKLLMENQSIDISIIPNLSTLIGRKLNFHLESDLSVSPPVPSILNQDYIISNSSLILQGNKGFQLITISTTSFNATGKTTIGNIATFSD